MANARLKVLFLIISYDAPSSRIRCTDMQDLLEAQGIDVEITEVPDRVIARFRLFRRASEFDAVVLQKKILRWFDETVVDGLVLIVGRTNRAGGGVFAWFDKKVVDGAVNGVGALTQTFGFIARLFQTGRVQQYASFAVAGGLAVAAWLLLG